MLIQPETRIQHAVNDAFQPLALDIFGSLVVGFNDADPQSAELHTADFGACRLSHITASAHSVDGARAVRRSFDPDAIKLILQNEGHSRLKQANVELELVPGSWVAYDPTKSYSLDNLSPVKQLILQLPRHNIPAAALQQLMRPNKLDIAERSLHKILYTMMSSALDQVDGLDAEGQSGVGDALLHLAKTLVLRIDPEDLERSAVSLKTLRMRVKAYIETNLSRSDLDIAELAQKMGCSRRYLFRAFEQDETTPSEFLWGLRLDKSLERLSSSKFAGASISEIAFSCGFSSSSHFSRAFRKRFDISPSEARHAKTLN